MNRNRILVPTIAVTAFACIALYVSQSHRLAEAEAAVAKKKAMLGISDASFSATSARLSRVRRDNPNLLSLPQALKRVAALQVEYADRPQSDMAYLGSAGELLGKIRGLPLEDLLALADAMEVPADDLGKKNILKRAILSLAAEIDPQAVLARADVAGNSDLAVQPLAELAKRDLAAALRWAEASGFREFDLAHLKETAISAVFEVDFQDGLRVASEYGVSTEILRSLSLEPGMIDQAAAALADPRNAAVRKEIVGKIMESASYYSGIDGMRGIAAKHHIPDADIAAFLAADHGKATWNLDPVKSVTWMGEVLSEEQKLKLIPQTLSSWMDDDYNAAAAYLGQMPPSAIKDRSLGSFVVKTAEIDPSTSALWLMQISDPEIRKAATGALLFEWRKSDPQAASAWLKQQGLTDAGF